MPTYIADPMEVKLERYRVWEENAAIPGWVEFNQYRVFVYSEGLAYRNEAKRLQVGLIGTQDGANFCPTGEFESFVFAHQQWIAAEAKRLHGKASSEPHIPLPPPLAQESEQEDGDEAEDTDRIES